MPEAEKRQEMNPGSQDQPKQSQDRNPQLLPPGWASQAMQVFTVTASTTAPWNYNKSDGNEPCPSTRTTQEMSHLPGQKSTHCHSEQHKVPALKV